MTTKPRTKKATKASAVYEAIVLDLYRDALKRIAVIPRAGLAKRIARSTIYFVEAIRPVEIRVLKKGRGKS